MKSLIIYWMILSLKHLSQSLKLWLNNITFLSFFNLISSLIKTVQIIFDGFSHPILFSVRHFFRTARSRRTRSPTEAASAGTSAWLTEGSSLEQKLGQVSLDKVWLGQFKLGQVRVVQVRLGQVRLGQVKLGQVADLR